MNRSLFRTFFYALCFSLWQTSSWGACLEQAESKRVARPAMDYFVTKLTKFCPELQAIIRNYAIDPLDFINALYSSKVLKGHTGLIYSVAISAHDGSIITGSHDRTARLWDKNGDFQRFLPEQTRIITSVAYGADGTSVTGSLDGTARIKTRRDESIINHPKGIEAVAIDDDVIVTGGLDHKARLWSKGGAFLKTLNGHTDWVCAVAIKGTRIATGSMDKTIRVWDRTGNFITSLKNQGEIHALVITDEQDIISNGFDRNGTVLLWYNSTNYRTHELLTNYAGLYPALALSPDNQTLIAGSGDMTEKSIEIMDLASRSRKAILRGHEKEIRAAAIGSDGTIVTASEDTTAILRTPDQELMTMLTQQLSLQQLQQFAQALIKLENQMDTDASNKNLLLSAHYAKMWQRLPANIKDIIQKYYEITITIEDDGPNNRSDKKASE